MTEGITQDSTFMAVRFRGALPRPFRWSKEAPEIGAELIVERPGGGEEVVTVVGGEAPADADLPHALATVTPDLMERLERRQEFERKAFAFARQRARSRGLKVKFVRCAIMSGSKVTLYYASENRDDVRDLMRDFAYEFGAEVELVQLATRAAASHLGGLGPCGRTTCCSTFLKTFPNPNTKMAKDQGISLTPQKLSGRCGKLKCCLAYEADTYREYLEEIALRVGHKVRTPKGYAKIIDLNVLQRKVRVLTLGKRDISTFGADEVERVKGGIPEGDEAAGFFYGPDGPPQRARVERVPRAERRPRSDAAAPARQSERGQDKPQRSGSEEDKKSEPGDRPKRRRRRGGRKRGRKKDA